jgi:predicted enzyme related to lactoylglutathione lyase
MERIMLKKVAFTMYPVVDIERAQQFYKECLGLECTHIAANGAWIEYDLPEGGCFALTNMAEGVAPSNNSGGSVAFEVKDLDQLVSDLKNKGVEFKLDIFDTPVCRIAIINDSEGNAVNLHELKRK